ncbi:hypothetical protein GA830_10540 [Mesorhizobium sp. NBSH29]|uniref:hypothetical protein n=1 Tax=Mesorhizobium sp. NBSH29 TaxID=2654249 RepID=UPI00189683A2|nr:hypothetical protein [Mesorhizobium sp. NBSH29]QPC87132.1 hypothetical protein GA830_10540 [Mesorhizobium sp. NBSH29]
MFDVISKGLRLTANIATLPVSLAVDAVTFGGELTDREEAYTVSKTKRIADDFSDIIEDIAG